MMKKIIASFIVVLYRKIVCLTVEVVRSPSHEMTGNVSDVQLQPVSF
jgi:hypothetical protein